MKSLFITATNTNIGKTYSTHLLADYMNSQGIKTIIAKPIETGDNGNEILDCQRHSQYNLKIDQSLSIEDINFYRYKLPASPFVAKKYENISTEIDFDMIYQKLSNLESKCDVLLIEGAGGLMVPINEEYNMLDLARFLKASMCLISSDKLGMINDLVLNIEFLKSKNIPCIYAINLINEENYNTISKPYIEYLNTKLPNPIYILQKDISKITHDFLSFS
ncbi:dethiobiotin synthase [Helicobacter cappadocius]|uniref:ATP-dependent dethiobiotin synthetase BioD n=1 Tax=Helicobacter cappadocius TaxID=3063998 RepID=A0AA90PVN5_9HELI|nr:MULTISPECIES: dethiobiotin synthase [unclassified Helicobacter]MDO7253231.1 dethiobiotin synthase [Helicobacter sp. faydin-H75]MDP2539155.1 dethiobiotin synthase [Helicobacter sp. faydin-H76]